jgi:hypothetical protein
VWTSFQAGAGNQGHVVIADVDRDGVGYEVCFASQDQHVYAIDAATGQEKWRFNTGANQQTNPVFVADVNNDGEYEVVTWTDQPSSAVFVIAFWGSELGRWTHPREGINIRIGQAFGDVDNDGNLEMACMSGDTVFLIDMATLTTEWEINFTQWSAEGKLPPGATANHWSSYQLIADIDGDGAQEILWLAPFPIVTDAATGTLEGYYWDDNIAANRRQESSAAWGDPDGDGISEWVCELNGNSHPETMIYSLTMGGAFPAEATWPEYIHSALPAEMQNAADWLTLKGAYSNSYWMPIPEVLLPSLAGLLLLGLLWRRR